MALNWATLSLDTDTCASNESDVGAVAVVSIESPPKVTVVASNVEVSPVAVTVKKWSDWLGKRPG